MSLGNLARQAVEGPLRLAQQVTGGGRAFREELDRSLADLDRSLAQRIREEMSAAMAPLANQLVEVQARLEVLQRKMDEIHDDTTHVRTEQAATRAREDGA